MFMHIHCSYNVSCSKNLVNVCWFLQERAHKGTEAKKKMVWIHVLYLGSTYHLLNEGIE